MEILNFDSGVKEYQINGGSVLRFNPSDPNVFARYVEAVPKIKAVEKDMSDKANALKGMPDSDNMGEQAVLIMRETDKKMKAILSNIFGMDNDFEEILSGVNLMAVGTNGERVIANLLNALDPIVQAGAKSFTDARVETARLNREQRRAMQK